MSKTPRTDEKEFKLYDESISRPCSVVRSSFARELETELAEARTEIERLTLLAQNQDIVTGAQRRSKIAKDKLIEQMREALEIALDCVKEIHGEESRDYTEIEAALAAERITNENPNK